LLYVVNESDQLMVKTEVDDTLTIFKCLFLAPETSASRLVPETTTHFASK